MFKKLALCLVIPLLMYGCGSGNTSVSEISLEVSESSDNDSASNSEISEVSGTSDETNSTSKAQTESETKILVAYFSATGNTRPIAEEIANVTDADLYEIIPEQPYSENDLNYNNENCRANLEQNDDSARPVISGIVDNMESYDVIFLGYPIWWGKEPKIIDTFMESYDFSGKTIIDFCTSGGSGISQSESNLKEISPDSVWLEGKRFSDVSEVSGWLEELNI